MIYEQNEQLRLNLKILWLGRLEEKAELVDNAGGIHFNKKVVFKKN